MKPYAIALCNHSLKLEFKICRLSIRGGDLIPVNSKGESD